jgi:hypothetical protein
MSKLLLISNSVTLISKYPGKEWSLRGPVSLHLMWNGFSTAKFNYQYLVVILFDPFAFERVEGSLL